MSDEEDPGPPRAALAALLLIAALVLGSFWLYHRLHGTAALQDCVMAGRRDCAPVR